MKTTVLALITCVFHATAAAGSDFTCGSEQPTLSSVSLDMGIHGVQNKFGPGHLVARSPDPEAELQFFYRWRIGAAQLDVTFDPKMKTVAVRYSARTIMRPYSNVALNMDTIKSIKQKFGPPPGMVGPMFGEGEYAFYSISYFCGPNSQDEVSFGAQLECRRPDMDACLSTQGFDSRPIGGVTLRRRSLNEK
jgi:hypothetical protein